MKSAEDTCKALHKVASSPLPYEKHLEVRATSDISLVVIHCTELPDLQTARRYAEEIHYPDSGTGNAGHYYVDRDGAVVQYVSDDRVAHHVKGHNRNTIGIELVNRGRYPQWFDTDSQQMTDPYPDKQIEALSALLIRLRNLHPSIEAMAGHADLDRTAVPASNDATVTVRRKLDPGPMFPWRKVEIATAIPRVQQVSQDDVSR